MGSISQPTSTTALFTPLRVGNYELQHRVALAPLTRYRASESHVPLPFVKEYYGQRASAPGTLLVTEGTFIAPQAGGYSHAPGIYSADQIKAWKEVTDAVHANGSRIFVQLWALGRAADAAQLKAEFGNDAKVVSASDIAFEGGDKPTPLTVDEIQEYVQLYTQAAKNAIEAGFDGVEFHGANGYLLDQFTQDVSNNRTDAYGGSIANRARFPLEAARAVVDAIGAERVGYRISPFGTYQGMRMADPLPQFEYLIKGLRDLGLAYLHIVESRISGNIETDAPQQSIRPLVDFWTQDGSAALVAGGFTPESAKKLVDEEYAGRNVGVVFGRYFISNPDLVFRIKEGIKLEPYNRSLFYNKTEVKGYTTYPFSEEFLKRGKVAA